MSVTEKFMFDTIFDELETIEPELADDDLFLNAEGEELLEVEPEEEIVPTFSEEEVNAARQEGIATGREQGVSATLAGIEKSTNDALVTIANKVAALITAQDQTNKELSNDATALSLAIVRKFFPTLNEDTALNEVVATVETLLGRLLNEPRIFVKVNPSISDELAEKLTQISAGKNLEGDLTVIADENIMMGDCKIEWSIGAAERNLTALMGEIDGIIAQNSTLQMESLTTIDPEELPAAEEINTAETESAENTVDLPENSAEIPVLEAAFEQNVKDEELELENAGDEEDRVEDSENEVVLESNDENDRDAENEDNNTP